MPTQRFFQLTCIALIFAALLGFLAWPCVAMAQAEPAAMQEGNSQLLLPAQQDASVSQQAPLDNFGAGLQLRVGRMGLDPSFSQWALLQWDLAALPPAAQITRAELRLFQTTGGAQPLLLYRILRPWDASRVTWQTVPPAELAGSWTPPADGDQYVRQDITQLVADWVNSPANNPNYGLLLRPDGRTPETRVFDSLEAAAARPPLLYIEYSLPPLRVCYTPVEFCEPAVGAELFTPAGGDPIAVAGADGYVDSSLIALGDELWARLAVARPSDRSVLYATSPQVTTVTGDSFQFYSDSEGRELRMAVSRDKPLLLYDLDLSAQWYLQDDPGRIDWLRTNLIRASDYLYDFSEGQFALGRVTVRQMYEGWDGANIKLLTSNVLHPNAVVGGIVLTETSDISSTILITYTPGSIFMGSYWNRFGEPPGQEVKYQGVVVTEAEMRDDWAIALAHELGHYLLFLFDTYTDGSGVSSETIAEQCAGSAMGNAYKNSNHAFIADQAVWDTNCGATEAHLLLNGRSEWGTIQAWYDWVVVPPSPALQVYPPVPLTQVVFVPATASPAPLAASQVYTLEYQLGQTSSGEARAFLLRDDSLIFEQGKPAQGTDKVELVDARLGDRLCVFDFNDHAEAPDAPRHQFGCESVTAGDSQLAMTLDSAWNPLVTIEQTGPQQLQVSVVQPLVDGSVLRARLIPETDMGGPPQELLRSGDTWRTTFSLASPVPPLYLQVWVEESPAAPQTRRETIADRGAGGNGAYGPARLHSGVLAVSSDGNASYASDEPLELGPGESIAWQSMPGTPPLPPWKRIAGQSYRLDAFPTTLVAQGTISIEYTDSFGVLTAAGAAPQAEPAAQLHFWNGSQWLPLSTTLATPASAADGVQIASARSQGIGVYAVLQAGQPNLYLPQLRR